MGILFVTHNLGVVAEIADRVAVMYAGRIVETGDGRGGLRAAAPPLHARPDGLGAAPRRGAALKAAGRPLRTIAGNVPSLAFLPKGCSFAPRCAMALDACRAAVPPMAAVTPTQSSRCLRWAEL